MIGPVSLFVCVARPGAARSCYAHKVPRKGPRLIALEFQESSPGPDKKILIPVAMCQSPWHSRPRKVSNPPVPTGEHRLGPRNPLNAPLSPSDCRDSTVAALARHYGGASLSVDAVVTAMLLNGTSPVSLTARRLYDQAAEEYAEKKAEEAAHLLASVPDPQSAPASLDTAENSEDSCSQNESNAPQETENTHFALCLGGDVTTLCNLLPEQLLVDVLAERFQLSDCHRGIVMDGLESVYTQSAANTLQAVLKALNNRKHIYTVNLSDSYTALQARERAQRETEEALQKEISDRKEQWLQELDEEEYDALPEEDKEQIARHHIENRRQQKVRELEHILKEEEEQRQQEEMKRLREEELKKKSKKGGKKDVKETSRKKSLLEGKQSTDGLNGNTMSPSNNSKESLVDAKEQHHLNEVHQSKEADDLQKQTEETKALNTESPQPADKVDREKILVVT
ncbi:hydrocephalus-inducing protein homolog [Notothenia coriiceps]|uniref:Hydrocephalus-inducing protein homolog n=1 Tax=Notothenia coriiceps TaxID=8208 RepID=A0A6I9NP70_9TELE|nr:PREDICTED: hydrocephalus-inducing protein homolog [Notothenia coriiceps]